MQLKLELPNWATYGLLAGFMGLVLAAVIATFFTVRNLVASAPLTDASGVAIQEPESPQAAGGDPQATLDPNWIEGRVTVLVMGIDERDLEEGPPRTDTMILVTVDPANQRAGMISIPRDLWVNIPNYNGVYDKINTAYFRGEADNYPGGGGPTLARLTVQQSVTGRPVPYYLTVNFDAFRQVIDEIGCIPLTVPQTINDETYPDENFGYDPFRIEAGEHCLDGDTLLKYARTRATEGADFDRAARQQQVIYAVRDHVLDTSQMPNLLSKAPELYGTVSEGVRTNLTLSELMALARLAADIPEENICSAVIDSSFVDLAQLDDGTRILIPDRARINQLMEDIYEGTGRCSPEAAALAPAALAENATISVLNATRREGLATDTAEGLGAAGLVVTQVGNDGNSATQTVIEVYTGKMDTARYIAAVLGLPGTAIVERAGVPSDFDIRVVLGSDLP
jgi:LCP family protein required for cell wall assembly